VRSILKNLLDGKCTYQIPEFSISRQDSSHVLHIASPNPDVRGTSTLKLVMVEEEYKRKSSINLLSIIVSTRVWGSHRDMMMAEVLYDGSISRAEKERSFCIEKPDGSIRCSKHQAIQIAVDLEENLEGTEDGRSVFIMISWKTQYVRFCILSFIIPSTSSCPL
jgi:hypothetical protein